MCILFYHVKKISKPGQFRIVIVSNRDEMYKRPTLSAHFWTDYPYVFGGRDEQEGDAGGTWLAVSKKGRLATLLNITSPSKNPNARSRGHLVKDFVSSQIPINDFISKVSEEAQEHNPFHLIAMNIMPEDVKVDYVGLNTNNIVLGPENLSPSEENDLTGSLSNTPLHKPMKKAKEGLEIFKNILSRFDTVGEKENLINGLIDFAKTDTKFYPDPVMTEDRPETPTTEKFSSIFVKIPEVGYGTRTHTVILVDHIGHVDVIEMTLTPSAEWQLTREAFNIEK